MHQATYNERVRGERPASLAPKAVPWAAALALLLIAASADAHLGPAAVRAVLAMEAGEPTILLLNEGLALRRGDDWHYICPAIWGDEEMLDADALPGGPVLIGSNTGVQLFGPDGRAQAHPEAITGGGLPLRLAANDDDVMQLRLDMDLFQVLRLGPDRAEIIWSGVARWDTMGVGPDFVYLVSMNTGEIQTLRLATDGTELDRETVIGPDTGLGAIVQVVDDTIYLILKRLLEDGSWGVEVGLIEAGTWRALHTGSAFVGPTRGPGGQLIAGIDGQLSTFDDHAAEPMALETVVNCVDTFDGFVYACDSIGLREITEDGPGPAIFELLDLLPPPGDLVSEDQRAACDRQWTFYQQDLSWIGMTVDGGGLDDGVDLPPVPDLVPDAGSGDAGTTPDAGPAAALDAGRIALPPDGPGSAGCSCHAPGGAGGGAPGAALLLALTGCIARWRSRSRR